VNILGRVSNINHRVIQTFEDTVKVETPTDLLERTKNNLSVYWKALPLPPGRYKVEIAIKDVNNADHVGVWRRSVDVPKFDEDRLASSSLILADQMERVPSKDVGTGNFVIGNTKLRPRVPPNDYDAGDVPSGAEPELLDAGVQPGHLRQHEEERCHDRVPDPGPGDEQADSGLAGVSAEVESER
jgi:hypothetical protein